jgi:viologen exporter family transport system permease protein
MARYLRLWLALARFSLAREMAFRLNFVVKVFVEILWLSILLLFYRMLFTQTSNVADWSQGEYLFFVGCYFTFQGLIEALVLENCNQFADLVRTGDLDFYLLQPIDEQFLVSFRVFDWSCVPNVLMGIGVIFYGLYTLDWNVEPLRVPLFLLMMVCGAGLAYGFLLLLTSMSVWLVRNQSLFEMWWLFSTLMRYPREIFNGPWAFWVAAFFSFVVPVMLVTNVPARIMVKALEPLPAIYTAAATVIVLWVSRRLFRAAMRRYRSASS